MQFTCSQSSLKDCLSSVSAFATTKGDNLILSAVLMCASKETQSVVLTAFDGSMGITKSFTAEVAIDGQVAVLAKTINSIISRLPKDKPLEVQQIDTELILKSSGKFKINLLDSGDHPGLPSLNNPTKIALDSKVISQGLQYCLNAASSDETKQILTGVRLVGQDDSILFAATDSHQLATVEVECKHQPFEPITIPRLVLIELQKLIKDSSTDVQIAIADTLIQFVIDNCQIISPLIPGDYPKFKQLIPTDFVGEFTCDRLTLLHSVESAISIGSNTTPVVFSFDIKSETLTIKAIAKQIGESTYELDVSLIGDPIKITFNSKYMSNMLRSLSSQEIKMQFCSADRPVIFSEVGGTKCIYLLMPIIVRD